MELGRSRPSIRTHSHGKPIRLGGTSGDGALLDQVLSAGSIGFAPQICLATLTGAY